MCISRLENSRNYPNSDIVKSTTKHYFPFSLLISYLTVGKTARPYFSEVTMTTLSKALHKKGKQQRNL